MLTFFLLTVLRSRKEQITKTMTAAAGTAMWGREVYGQAMPGLRAWLLFLAIFEVPPIYECLSGGADKQQFDGFASNLQPGTINSVFSF